MCGTGWEGRQHLWDLLAPCRALRPLGVTPEAAMGLQRPRWLFILANLCRKKMVNCFRPLNVQGKPQIRG